MTFNLSQTLPTPVTPPTHTCSPINSHTSSNNSHPPVPLKNIYCMYNTPAWVSIILVHFFVQFLCTRCEHIHTHIHILRFLSFHSLTVCRKLHCVHLSLGSILRDEGREDQLTEGRARQRGWWTALIFNDTTEAKFKRFCKIQRYFLRTKQYAYQLQESLLYTVFQHSGINNFMFLLFFFVLAYFGTQLLNRICIWFA